MAKVCLITGASSGFGLLTALELKASGEKVYAGLRDPEGRNSEVAGQLTDKGIHVVELDVTVQQHIDQAVSLIEKTEGRLDVLFNNAGMGQMGVTEGYTLEQMKSLFEINVFGVFSMNRAFLPMLRKSEDGLIIYTSSGLGRFVLPNMAIYCSSKWALEAMAESLAYEIKAFGIDSTIIEPGAYPTAIFGKEMQPDDKSRLDSYPHAKESEKKLQEGLLPVLKGENANSPDEISRFVKKLLEMENGERPLRVLLGKDTQGLQPINNVQTEVQKEVMQFFIN